ncbi:MAG: DUF4194 domain-containing protein [Acholeplasmatales bacterium]|jgi:hypothetical protein|nr:DUF4194 domain-containing protein [Acholeplasmatales bacterium]
MIDKTFAIKKFFDAYSTLREGEKDLISRITNKLLQVNFLTKKKPDDLNDFHSILEYHEVFSSLLVLLDFELNIERADEVIYIKNVETFNHRNLKKIDSIVLLVFRILFERKRNNITLGENVEVDLKDMHDELSRVYDDKRLQKEVVFDILRLLKGYNLIDFQSQNPTDTTRIKIYPTIKYCIDVSSLEDLVKRLEHYTTPNLEGGHRSEEINED